MNQDKSTQSRSKVGKSSLGAVCLAVLIGAYTLAQPALNAKFGWNLPKFGADAPEKDSLAKKTDTFDSASKQSDSNDFDLVKNEAPAASDVSTAMDPSAHPVAKLAPNANTSTNATPPTNPPPKNQDAKKSSPSKPLSSAPLKNRGPLADRMSPTKSQPTSSKSSPSPSSSPTSKSAQPKTNTPKTIEAKPQDSNLRYGILREISRDRYVSPAGLLYTPGSAEGHRLEHLRRHTLDDPKRPGSHGVFDGEIEGALKTIDKAYLNAKEGKRTTTSEEDGRTIYTVDMGGRVGFVGGQDGGRKRNPMARRVRLVLEGNRVITAFPL